MRIIYSTKHREHAPHFEISDGQLKPALEVPERVEIIHRALIEANLGPVQLPRAVPMDIVCSVHDEGYIRFLEDFARKWKNAGRKGEALPFVFPVRTFSETVPDHIDGLLGRYAYDAGTPINENTWNAALESASIAYTGALGLLQSDQAVFSLCRPPGHHAGKDMFGGYCYLNNAAIAAQTILNEGAKRVAILDVDMHHGNGTQSIFYDRDDVLTVSIHADPRNEYPYFSGYAHEVGEGKGEGFNRNIPLPRGTEWRAWSNALDSALETIRNAKADALIVSLGLDTYEGDPLSQFQLNHQDFKKIGDRIGNLGMKTLFVMEGGYAISALGKNCVAVLSAFENA
jgi:acetoin utilization deacetylase AcuC-like enzyme